MNTKHIDRARLPLILLALAFGAGTVVSLSECTGSHPTAGDPNWLTPPVTTAALSVPGGAAPTARFHGTGVQIYTCTAAADSTRTPAWSLKGPDAVLLDAGGAEAGTHGIGPAWTSKQDGSSVVGTKVAQADAPAAGAVPWLLLQAKSHGGAGTFSTVAFIQRLNTAGGVAPAAGCSAATIGAETRVAYEADYYFY